MASNLNLNKSGKNHRRHISVELSTEAIGDIRSYFFKAIVELFREYKSCVDDYDQEITFSIEKYVSLRPDSYRSFYDHFFKG